MFKLLETFITVFETRNFSKAATQLFISQPTVSVHIHQLESELGTALFTHNGRTEIIPTEQAKQFYPQALTIIDEWAAAQHAITQHNNQRVIFRIAASHTTAISFLPQVLKFLMPKIDTLDIHVEMQNSERVLEDVSQHKIDLGLIEKPITADNVMRQIAMHDQLVLAGHSDQALWLIRETGSGVYHYTQQYFKIRNIVPKHSITVASNDTIIALLQSGIGQSIISEKVLPSNIPSTPLSEEFKRDFYLISPQHTEDQTVRTVLQDIWSHFKP